MIYCTVQEQAKNPAFLFDASTKIVKYHKVIENTSFTYRAHKNIKITETKYKGTANCSLQKNHKG